MMLKYKETEYTGGLRSEEIVQSRKSYPENQDILYPGRLHPTIYVLVKERNLKVLSGNAATAKRMENQGTGTAFCFFFITAITSIPENQPSCFNDD